MSNDRCYSYAKVPDKTNLSILLQVHCQDIAIGGIDSLVVVFDYALFNEAMVHVKVLCFVVAELDV